VIRSHHHEVFTEQVNKIALSADDAKRMILPDRKIPLLTGIGRFRLSDKTSIQTDNARGGQTEVLGITEESWERQGALENRGQRSERVLVASSTRDISMIRLTDKMGIF